MERMELSCEPEGIWTSGFPMGGQPKAFGVSAYLYKERGYKGGKEEFFDQDHDN